MDFDLFLLICNYIGTIAFSVSGVVKGFKKNLDIFGITLLGILTAVGGGIIRDTMIGQVPTALTDPTSIYLSTTVALIMYTIVRIKKSDVPLEKQMLRFLTTTNLVFDSIGLAIFALIGASAGTDLELNAMTSGILATLTGVGGGILRDVLVNETPIVLKEDVYAVLALGAGISYHLLVVNLHLPKVPVYTTLFILFLLIRLTVIKYHLRLPNMDNMDKKISQH